MKKILLSLLLMCTCWNAHAQIFTYDVNGDGKESIEDVTCLVKHLLGRYEYVDLGLSVNWATCNVGATHAEDYGLYFAWGETTGYTSDTSDGRSFDWESLKYCEGTTSSGPFTKYVTSEEYGTPDDSKILENSDDAARHYCGGIWRTPTTEEWQDLLKKCSWTWTTQNGVKGYKVTSKVDGYTDKFIFLPAAGGRIDKNFKSDSELGIYWSSTLAGQNYQADVFVISESSSFGRYYYNRCYGLSVRPVCTK